MLQTVTIELPAIAIEGLQHIARRENRSMGDAVANMVRERYTISITPDALEDELPLALRLELNAMAFLSDSALWALASSSLTPDEWQQLKTLNASGGERLLSVTEQAEQTKLLDAYDAMLLRRAHAAVLLKQRGYDVSDPTIFAQVSV